MCYHASAPTLPPALSWLVGADGSHAHVLTLVGMRVAVLGLMVPRAHLELRNA